ncbi:MAG: LysM peptidoglycan-binding domain-containing protein, partial [Candidatus Omnitrophota bacterium]
MNKKLLIIAIAIIALIGIIFIFASKKASGSINPVNRLSIRSMLNQAQALEAKGELLEAKIIYDKLVNDYPESKGVMNWQKKAENINIKLLFSPVITPKSISYQIKPGDTLIKIAREYKTTPELIMKSNNISDSLIIPGRKIKVWTAPFNILVDKSQNILWLKSGEEIFKTYTVSTGKNNCSPVGTFKIVNKLPNPTW